MDRMSIGSDQSQDPCRNNSDELDPKLSWVPEEKAVITGCIDCLGGEKGQLPALPKYRRRRELRRRLENRRSLTLVLYCKR